MMITGKKTKYHGSTQNNTFNLISVFLTFNKYLLLPIVPDIVSNAGGTYTKSTTRLCTPFGKQIQRKETKYNIIIKNQAICGRYRWGENHD